ncbi:hypothetical protein ACRAWF_35985 [Streptomyces sp. L7]
MGSTPAARTGLLLTDHHPVAVSGTPLPYRPRFTPLGGIVSVSPHTDQRSHESLLSETFGSVDWLSSANDEFRFGKADEELKGITLYVPDDAFPASRALCHGSTHHPPGRSAVPRARELRRTAHRAALDQSQR